MYIDARALMYYETNLQEFFRRTAYYVDRILIGTRVSAHRCFVGQPTHLSQD